MTDSPTNARPAAASKTESLVEATTAALDEMILAGEIRPGERINERALSQSMQISRGPIREACRRLEEAGLVEIIPNRGAFVKQVSLGEALELYDIRAQLDAMAGSLLCDRVTRQDVADLKQQLKRMDQLARKGDLTRYLRENLAFHDRLIELTRNRRLLAMYRNLINELYLHRQQSLSTTLAVEKSCGEHRAILDALASGDGASLAARMREHVENGKARLLMTANEPDEQ